MAATSIAHVASLALALCAATLHAPDNAKEIDVTIPPGCSAAHTGEGFPSYVCPDGTAYYVDLDGDGIDPATDGRLVATDPSYLH